MLVLDAFGARASATSIRKVQDEVVDRLKKEASSLARLRHPIDPTACGAC